MRYWSTAFLLRHPSSDLLITSRCIEAFNSMNCHTICSWRSSRAKSCETDAGSAACAFWIRPIKTAVGSQKILGLLSDPCQATARCNSAGKLKSFMIALGRTMLMCVSQKGMIDGSKQITRRLSWDSGAADGSMHSVMNRRKTSGLGGCRRK